MRPLKPGLSTAVRAVCLLPWVSCGWQGQASVVPADNVGSAIGITATGNPPSSDSATQFTLPGTSLIWVAALPREGHVEACARHGLGPSSPVVILSTGDKNEARADGTPAGAADGPSWSADLLFQVADGLGLELARPGGVKGCCVPGMWCGSNGCYTLAVGNSFSNHGGYVGMPADEYSVYTCLESDVQSVEAPAVDSTYSSSSASGSEPSSPAQLSVDSGHNDEGLTGSPSATTDCNTNSSSICSSGSSANSSSPQIDETGQADGSYPALPPPSTIYSVIPAVAKSGEALTLIGSGFGEDRAVVRVMVGGRECRDPELCHRVCRPCDDKHPCDFDEMCMQDDLSKNKVCLPFCDGPWAWCPCDHICMPRHLGMPHRQVVHLCRPPDADPNFLCHGSVLRDQERIQCTVPVLAWNEAETEASQHVGRDSGLHNGGRRAEQGDRGLEEVDKKEEGREGWGVTKARVSVSVGDRAAVWAEGVAYAPNSCRSANDCDDGDFCSLDACVKRKCVHNGVREGYGCQAQPASVRFRGDAYRYFQIVNKADPIEQSEFVAAVQAEHRISSVTAADDDPVEFHNWSTEFPIYGTKYEGIIISPNGALFVPPRQSVTPGGRSAVSPSTEAFFPVLLADWNPADTQASSVVLLMIEENQFSVLYQDVFLFRKSAEAKPSTFSITVFPDGSLRYRYMHIGDRSAWTAGVSGNSFVSPTIRDRHVRQAEIINMHEDGRPIPYAHASTFAASSAATKSSAAGATTSARPSIGSGSSARTIDSANGDDGDSSSNDVMTKSSSPSSDGVGQSAGEDDDLVDDQAGGGMGQEGLGSEVTLCRVPTIACLGSACGQAGSNISVLWEGFGCQAAGLNVTFACSFAGTQVRANTHGLSSSPSATTSEQDGWKWGGGKEGEGQQTWGPAWAGGDRNGGAVGGGLVCQVPRLDWVEDGEVEAVMVPVEVLWSLPGQTSESFIKQVSLSSVDVAVRGLSVAGDDGLVNSHVLAFRYWTHWYYREDTEVPDCGCSPSARQTGLTCDSCLVCGGSDSTKDCGGFCHGEAYHDPCGDCAGGMTGATGCTPSDEYGDYFDSPSDAELLSLSQSIMMLVALSIVTAFLTTCLFVVRALMIRGILAVEGDQHGAVRRRIFARRRGLSPSEMTCLELVEYVSLGSSDDSAGAIGANESVPKGEREGGGGVGEGGKAEGDGRRQGEVEEDTSSFRIEDQCSICLNDFEGGEILRKMPCRHLFHQECVDEWLHLSISCPLCKRNAREGMRRQSDARGTTVPASARLATGYATAAAAPRGPATGGSSHASTGTGVGGRRGRRRARESGQGVTQVTEDAGSSDGGLAAVEPEVVYGRRRWWLSRFPPLLGGNRAHERNTVAGDGVGEEVWEGPLRGEGEDGAAGDDIGALSGQPAVPEPSVLGNRATGRQQSGEGARAVALARFSRFFGRDLGGESSRVVDGAVPWELGPGTTRARETEDYVSSSDSTAEEGRRRQLVSENIRAALGEFFGFGMRSRGRGRRIRAGLGVAEYELTPGPERNVYPV